jgi:hypothetical protein
MCLLVGFHGEDARALHWQVLASWALGWTGQGYHTTTREEPHIGHRRYQHPDRSEISLKYVEVRWAVSLRVNDRDINILKIRWKTCAIKLHIFK